MHNQYRTNSNGWLGSYQLFRCTWHCGHHTKVFLTWSPQWPSAWCAGQWFLSPCTAQPHPGQPAWQHRVRPRPCQPSPSCPLSHELSSPCKSARGGKIPIVTVHTIERSYYWHRIHVRSWSHTSRHRIHVRSWHGKSVVAWCVHVRPCVAMSPCFNQTGRV